MPSLKVLSWNIQKFGEDKLSSTAFIQYVSLVIQKTGTDVVGIINWSAGTVTRPVRLLLLISTTWRRQRTQEREEVSQDLWSSRKAPDNDACAIL